MSTEYSTTKLDLNHPRSIWSLSLQLLYTLLAMIPVYYYLKNIVGMANDARYVLIITPIAVGILLFIMQTMMNQLYWRMEKIYKTRDIFTISLRSTVFVLAQFYIYYFFIFGFWFSGSEVYQEKFQVGEKIGRVLSEIGGTLLLIYGLISFRRTNFEQK